MSATETTWYRPGLQFTSHASAYQVICRPSRQLLTPDGVVYDETRELLAEFGVHGAEYSYARPDGTTDTAADIRGHFFDLDSQAEQKGWTTDEKEIVARKLLREIITKFPGECQLYSAPSAAKPWPKYDETHHNQVPVFAEQLGLVDAALAYEKQNAARPSVLAKLQEIGAQPKPTESIVEELTAA